MWKRFKHFFFHDWSERIADDYPYDSYLHRICLVCKQIGKDKNLPKTRNVGLKCLAKLDKFVIEAQKKEFDKDFINHISE